MLGMELTWDDESYTNTNPSHRNNVLLVFNHSLEVRKNFTPLKLGAVRAYQRAQGRRTPKDNIPGTSGESALHSKNDSSRDSHTCQPARLNHRKSVDSEPIISKEGFGVLILQQTRRNYFKKGFEFSARDIRGCVVRGARITIPDWSPDNIGGTTHRIYSPSSCRARRSRLGRRDGLDPMEP